MGQDDKGWSTLVMPLVDRKEEWWVTVMGVGLDPELSKVVRYMASFLATTRPRSCAERSYLHYLCISKLGPPLLNTS